MKRSLSLLFNLFVATSLILFITSCGDDSTTEIEVPADVYSISGTVTYPDFSGNSTGAGGAVVFLAKSAEATTNYDLTSVANSSGAYTFEGLEAGSYFVFANFNTANVNNGRIDGINFTGEGSLVEIVDANLSADLALTSIDQTVDFVVNTTDDSWNQDYSHSNIDFRFPYDEFNATYTGRFDNFTCDIVFDKSNLANSSITASVDLLSVNTSSPGGRDSWWDNATQVWDYGCLARTFGVKDTAGEPVADTDPPVSPDESTRFASFVSTSISTYGDGFMARGNFTFNGVTNEEVLFFRFINGFEGTNRSGDATQYSSFDGQLEFAALNDYGVESSHLVDEKVTVDISFQVTSPL